MLSTIEVEDMHRARIAELLKPFLSSISMPGHSEPENASEEVAVLSAKQLDDISTYIDILLRWNTRINLTAVREPEKIVVRHFGESLFAARQVLHAPRSSGLRVADLGSGAGFPGLPMKLWAPDISLTLIESNHKKAAFLREILRALGLDGVNVENARAETLPPSTFDFVTLRAVERFVDALPIVANLLSPDGQIVLLISTSQVNTTYATLPAFTWGDPIPIPDSQSRVLLVSQPRE